MISQPNEVRLYYCTLLKPRPCKFFGSTGEQAFQTFDDCLHVRSDWLKILKADVPVLPKKLHGLSLSFCLCSITTKNQIWPPQAAY